MKKSELIGKMQKWLIIPVVITLTLFSCKEEEDPIVALNKSRGVFEATINGEKWSSNQTWVMWNYNGEKLGIEGRNEGESKKVEINLDPVMAEGMHDYDSSFSGMMWYNSLDLENAEFWKDGFLNIVKYDQDSLIATFSFTTEHAEIKDGFVSISLDGKVGEPAN